MLHISYIKYYILIVSILNMKCNTLVQNYYTLEFYRFGTHYLQSILNYEYEFPIAIVILKLYVLSYYIWIVLAYWNYTCNRTTRLILERNILSFYWYKHYIDNNVLFITNLLLLDWSKIFCKIWKINIILTILLKNLTK